MMSGGRECQTSLEIILNGNKTQVPEGLTIMGLLHHVGLDPSRVAVEFDRDIVKAPAWPETALHEGAQVEIVMFVGGG